LLEGAKHPQPRQLYFSTFQDWQSVGRWYAALEKDRRVATPEVRTKADEVVQGAKTDREKAVAIYGYVARNIRYVSLSFGVGRFQPHAAADVLANQYGDCKDKATLLGAMLAAEGIHSSTALINSEADIDKSVPTPGQFDHAITIATVDGHDVWLDSTQAVGPYGYLLPQLRGKDALVADAERTSALATTPSQIPNPRLYKVSLEGTANDKTADLEMSFDVQGDDLEVVLRAMLLQLPAERLMALFNQQFKASAASRDSSWSDLKTSDPLDTKTALHFQARVTGETESADSPTDANAKSGDGTSAIAEILDSGLLSYVMSDPPKDSGAALPVSVGGPKEISLHLRVTNTDDKSQSFLMQPVDLKKDFAEYHGKASWDGNTLTADLDLNLLLKEIPAERAQEYVDFRRAVIESFGASGKKIVLAEEYQNGLDAYRARDLKRSADLLESVLQQDPSYKDAWNNLGRTYLDIGNLDQAEADFRKAIQNDPNDLYAYNNLGLTFLREQKYDEAIPQFQKQIEINAKDQYAHANLGKAYVQSQKYEDAVKELEIAQSLTPRDSTVAANLGIAYARLGRTDDAKRAFDTDLALDISPNRYDTLATQLADAGLELDLAEKYVQTAIDSEVSQLKTTSLDSIVPDDIRSAETLSERWNTLGWIKLQQGDTATAEKYMLAARQSALFIGANNHLGELYEKEGRKADAIHQYELDLILSSRDSATRTRLAALLGGDQNIDKQLDDLRKSHGVQLALQLPNPEKLDGRAYFYMLFSPGSDTPEIKLGSGDSDPRYQAKLRSQVSQFAPPEPLNVKLLRSAIVICTTPTNSCLIENGGPIRRPNSIPPLEPSGTLHRCRPRHPRARVPRSHLTNHLRQATA
jgi:tetratricopeptide (TPR) repeat protein